MSVVEIINRKGQTIKFEWDASAKRLSRVVHADGTVAERLDKSRWRVLSAESGTVEQEFSGDISVNDCGDLTVTQTSALVVESITLSLDGCVTRKLRLRRKNSARGFKKAFQVRQWSHLDHYDIGSRF